ncbi:MAG: serine/threonine protein kinase, partial [Candidatus Hydrogenedentes bacterium]|nr:serine/threonine protein kinase [Candidatus Hydrogenedentota bacterium]
MLSEGDKLGAFEITSLLGKGGMGEVYRARDTKLGREVAIKVLPEDFAQDKDRLKRFGREAKLLASLDHPNVGAIHEFQEADGVHFLVMQLVEGETLSERIRKGPLPLREALPIFVQIARGLDAAHESGIVHRDLKPANVKIAPNGDVKVLDFGIAKKTVVTKVDPNAPTTPMTSFPLTDEGTILGTPLYMSPEQARGKTVDSRTDIWAFGCCLYEALTGSTPFPGETMTDIFAAILERDPDWGALPDSVPREVRRLLRHCLEKNPRERLRDIADAQYELEEWERERAVAPDQGVPTAPPRSRMATVLFAGAGLLLAVLFMFAVTLFNRDRADEFAEQRSVREPIRSLVVLPFTNLMGDPEQE